MTPANIRKAAERERRAAAGLVRVELWVPAERADEIREVVKAALDDPQKPCTVRN